MTIALLAQPALPADTDFIRVKAAPAGVTFTLARQDFEGANCTGNKLSRSTIKVNAKDGANPRVRKDRSALLEAEPLSDDRGGFGEWSSADAFVQTANRRAICVNGAETPQPRVYTATYRAAALIVVKNVVNNELGTLEAKNFTLRVTGTKPSPASFAGEDGNGTAIGLDVGAYQVHETEPAGYKATMSKECKGTVKAGDAPPKCIVTNEFLVAMLTVTKEVKNTHGGIRGVDDFFLEVKVPAEPGAEPEFINLQSGVKQRLKPGRYQVGELQAPGYDATFKGDCDAMGFVTLAAGDQKTCRITNVDTTRDSDGDGILDIADCNPFEFDHHVVDPAGKVPATYKGKRHKTLQEAVTAAAHGDVISMYGDTTENVVIGNRTKTGGKDLHIMGCQHTITARDDKAAVVNVEASAGSGAANERGNITFFRVNVAGGATGVEVATEFSRAANPPGPLTVLTGVHAEKNGIGFRVAGKGILVSLCEAIENRKTGIFVSGSANALFGNSAFSNGEAGIEVDGKSNRLEKNFVGMENQQNRGDGIKVRFGADDTTLLENRVFSNERVGILILSKDNKVLKNDVGDADRGNVKGGIQVNGEGNRLAENKVFANGEFGIEVDDGTAERPNVLFKNRVGERGRGNKGSGIRVEMQDRGNGPKAPIEIEGNIVKANEGDGIRVLLGKGHQLKDNESGGAAKEDDNTGCEFLVDDGNINATGNKANDMAIPGANGAGFPTGCVGTDRPRR